MALEINDINAESISASTLSASTIYSGGTNLSLIFAPIGSVGGSGSTTYVQPGSNILTGGTINYPIISLVSSPSVNDFLFSGTTTGNALSVNSISASTIYSGSTNLIDIFGKKINNHVIVSSLSDFPTPVGNIIPLSPYYSYQINGTILMGSYRLSSVTENTIFGLRKLSDGLVYTGTDSLFVGSGTSIGLNRIFCSSPAGKVFSITGNTDNRSQISESVFANSLDVGDFNGSGVILIDKNFFSQNIRGLNFSGEFDECFIIDNFFYLNSGTSLFFKSNTSVETVLISRNIFDIPDTSFFAISASTNFNVSGGTISNNNFHFHNITSGDTFVTGITRSDINWIFQLNQGLFDSQFIGSMRLTGNTTPTTFAAVNTYVKALGTTLSGHSMERFVMSANNELKYIGRQNFTGKLICTGDLQSASASLRNYVLTIFKNSATTTNYIQTQVRSDNNSQNFALSSDINLITNDKVSLAIKNITNTNSVYINNMQFIID